MSNGQMGAPEGVPIAPLPEPKTFEVWWANPDSPVTMFTGITGSHLEDEILFLMKPDGKETIINLDQVRSINIWNDL